MSRESFVAQLIANDTQLLALGVQNVYRSNSMEDPPEDCYVVLIWGARAKDLPGLAPAQRNLVAWVYDTPGFYGRIDLVLDRLRVLLLGVTDQEVRQVVWQGDGPDQYDDQWRRALRTGAYEVH